jgi:hypothetical protein
VGEKERKEKVGERESEKESESKRESARESEREKERGRERVGEGPQTQCSCSPNCWFHAEAVWVTLHGDGTSERERERERKREKERERKKEQERDNERVPRHSAPVPPIAVSTQEQSLVLWCFF